MRPYPPGLQSTILKLVCAGVLGGILVVGLWPFHAPANQVAWLGEGGGLLFSRHGSILSAAPLAAHGSTDGGACGLEIWLSPSRLDQRAGGTVLAFYQADRSSTSFSLRQWRHGLVLQRENAEPDSTEPATSIFVPDVFPAPDVFGRSKPVLFAFTSGKTGTAAYVNGALVKTVPNFFISTADLTGELVVGNHPSRSYNWRGKLRGLAIYARELSAAQVSGDFAGGIPGSLSSQRNAAEREGLLAEYRFDEGRGNIVRNTVDSATNLVIPERFFVLHEQFLERPWDEFQPGWHYWKDILVNITGFIPLGFFFRAYFSPRAESPRATWATILVGFATSLTIEVLQAFLPTRDSGMTDLMTNTLGTALGTVLCIHALQRNWLGLAGDQHE